MLPRTSVEVSGTTMLALLSFLDRMTYRKGLAPNEVVDQAILAWIAAQQTAQSREPAGRGYRWKNVFLPSGTHLEVRTRSQAWRATVDGDDAPSRRTVLWRPAPVRRATRGAKSRCCCRASAA